LKKATSLNSEEQGGEDKLKKPGFIEEKLPEIPTSRKPTELWADVDIQGTNK
jgi:hypothetical protein